MKRITLLFIPVLLFNTGYTQQGIFGINSIPPALLKNTHAVIRDERIEFEIHSASKATLKTHRIVSLLDETAKNELFFYEFTDKFHSLEEVELKIYNELGELVKKYNRKDLTSQAAGEGLVPEGKVYYLDIPAVHYPITLETNYEIKYHGLLSYPGFHLQLNDMAIEHSVFSVTVPASLDLRYKLNHSNLAPVITQDGKDKHYEWVVQNQPVLPYEEGSISSETRNPYVQLAPNHFELDGFEGDMTSWESFGKWYASLAKNSINLDDKSKLFLNSLVKNAVTQKEKTRILYKYLQQNFRYVSIQLGIGGFRPFDASFVDNKKYGDCKALSNYMQACLDAIGIRSHQALINASYNKEPVDPDFPCNTFNHVIVCVPLVSDTVWLECTSNTNDFAELGSFTENRNALLITETGGKLVPTPKSRADENRFSSSSVIRLNEDGSGTATLNIETTGDYKQLWINAFADEKKDDQKKFLVNNYGFQHPDEIEIHYSKDDPKASVSINMQVERIPAFVAGNKYFLNPRIYRIWQNPLPKSENRTQDFIFEHPFEKTDTSTYLLPEGFIKELIPQNRDINTETGSFHSKTMYDEKKRAITVTAKLILNRNRIPVNQYAEVKKFFDQVLEEYEEKIVVRKL